MLKIPAVCLLVSCPQLAQCAALIICTDDSGLVQQKSTEDQDCILMYCRSIGASGADSRCRYVNQIRHILTHDREAKGPTFARAMALQLIKDEEFCMQIDSHMSFAKVIMIFAMFFIFNFFLIN
jgi:hypothetical protein